MNERFQRIVKLLKGIMRRYREGGVSHVVTYTIGRFYTVRSLCRFYCHCVGRRNSYDLKKSVFQGIRPDEVLEALRRRALFMGLNLPKADADEILRYAQATPCWSLLGNGAGRQTYSFAEKASEERRLGTRFILAHYEQPSRSCPAIARIQDDPFIRSVATAYLRREPRTIDARLWWSFVVDTTDERRLDSKQTIRFHYDAEGYLSLYFNFYLTDVDGRSGPHVTVQRSHGRKPLRFLLSSANRSDGDISKRYGTENVVTICGTAGAGFVEDAYCFHKVLPPRSRDRLFLQLRMLV